MSAVISSNASPFSVPANMAGFGSSFAGWMKELTSSLKTGAELDNALNKLLHDTPGSDTNTFWSQIDTVMARREVLAAESRIRELESELARMRELAHEDQLTGSLNRRGLGTILERELARSQRIASHLCVALIDLDNFKRINDTYGHCAGDAALVHLVAVVKDVLRKMDVIARYGGEEFVVVLPDTSLKDAIQTISRVQVELGKRRCMHGEQALAITFSAGVAMYVAGESEQVLIERADRALYDAKNAGKNCVVGAE